MGDKSPPIYNWANCTLCPTVYDFRSRSFFRVFFPLVLLVVALGVAVDDAARAALRVVTF